MMSEGGAPIGALAVRIGADASALVSELDKANLSLKNTGKAFESAGKIANTFAAQIGIVATALSAVVLHATKTSDTFYKLSQSSGIATSAFSEYAYAAKLSGVGTEELSTALARLNRSVAEAATLASDSSSAFMVMGIAVKNANGSVKNADQILGEIADKFASYEDGANKSALAMAIFGRAGAQMIPLLNQGARGISDMRNEARQLGLTIDTETGRAAERFNDNLTRLQQAGVGLGHQLMHELLPAMEQVADKMVSAAKAGGDLHHEMQAIAGFIQDTGLAAFQVVATVGADIAFVFKSMGTEIGVWAAQLSALSRGDIKGFSAIGAAWREDADKMRKDLDDFQARINNLRSFKNTSAAGTFESEGNAFLNNFKKNAPKIKDDLTKEIEKMQREINEKMAEITAGQAMRSQNQFNPMMQHLELPPSFSLIESDFPNAVGRDMKLMGELDAMIIKFQSDISGQDAANTGQRGPRDQIPERVQELAKTLKTEEELEMESHKLRLSDLQDYLDQELEFMGGRHHVEEVMEQNHQEKLRQIRQHGLNTINAFTKASWQQQAKTIFGELANITAGVAQNNRTMFEINKVAGIANAIINAYEGISLTMAKYPFPLNIAMAAAHGLAAFAQVQAIKNASFGGGGAPSIAGSTAAPAVSPVDTGGGGGSTKSGGQTTVIQLHGDVFGVKQLRSLFDSINEQSPDGSKIVLG